MWLKSIFVFLAFSLIAFEGYSQKVKTNKYQNVVYLEAGGIGGYGSLNYERIIHLPIHFSVSGRIGFSTIRAYDFTNQFNPDILFPIAINVFYGEVHKVHLGFGQIITSTIRASIDKGIPERVTDLHSNLTIGYRYQKQDSRLIFGISYSPIIEFQETYKHWGALTFGYTF